MSVACDLSVILTAHNETIVCGPTMYAVGDAIQAVENGGFTVERIMVFDSVTQECRDYFTQSHFDNWNRVEVQHGDLGLTRNEVVQHATGKYVAFLDADDLFSENWLLRGMERAMKAEVDQEKVILHPELNWLFDAGNSVFHNPDQDDGLFAPYYYYFANYYDSLCLCPRQAHLDIPYVSRDLKNGLAFQDWQFGIETMAAGWIHRSVKDTIIFKRRRDFSLVTGSSARGSIIRKLDCMAIDTVRDLNR